MKFKNKISHFKGAFHPASIILAAASFASAHPANAHPPRDNGVYRLKLVESQLCAMPNATAGQGYLHEILQERCDDSPSQQWQLAPNGDASYRLVNMESSGGCLTVNDAAQHNYGLVTRAPCGLPGQSWKFEATGAHRFLVATHSGKCLVVAGASLAPRGALTQYQCNGGENEKFHLRAVADTRPPVPDITGSPERAGRWEAPRNHGLVPAAAALLPDGKVLYWSATDTHGFHGAGTRTQTGVMDLATGSLMESAVDTGHEMFCPAAVMDGEGRVLVAGGGGTPRLRDRVSSYDWRSGKWRSEAALAVPRWYNSAAILPDGSVFTIGGDGAGGAEWTDMEKIGEKWTPGLQATQRWRLLRGTGEPGRPRTPPITDNDYGLARAQYYRKMVSTPSGRILEVAPSPVMRWHETTGDGATTVASIREGEGYLQGAITAQYTPDKVLIAGGSASFGNEDPTVPEANYPASARSFVVDLHTGTARPAAPMRHARYQANAVALPDGTVLAIGGAATSSLFDDKSAVLAPELYDPAAGTWSELAPMAFPRNYHSVALLLPDARVWAAGGGLCGTCRTNQANSEIFSPPYLFRGTRPLISAAPEAVIFGSKFNITAHGDIRRFTLVRLSAVTHGINTDQRVMALPFERMPGGSYELIAPESGHTAPPGFYMLFALSDRGVPSVSRILKVGR